MSIRICAISAWNSNNPDRLGTPIIPMVSIRLVHSQDILPFQCVSLRVGFPFFEKLLQRNKECDVECTRTGEELWLIWCCLGYGQYGSIRAK